MPELMNLVEHRNGEVKGRGCVTRRATMGRVELYWVAWENGNGATDTWYSEDQLFCHLGKELATDKQHQMAEFLREVAGHTPMPSPWEDPDLGDEDLIDELLGKLASKANGPYPFR